MSNKSRILEPEECHAIVSTTIKDVCDLIKQRVSVASPKQQWILFGRIVNGVWAQFYQPAFRKSIEDIMETSNERND